MQSQGFFLPRMNFVAQFYFFPFVCYGNVGKAVVLFIFCISQKCCKLKFAYYTLQENVLLGEQVSGKLADVKIGRKRQLCRSEVIAEIIIANTSGTRNYLARFYMILAHLAMPQRPMGLDMNLSQPNKISRPSILFS